MAQVNRRYYLKNEEVAMKAYADSAFTAARSYTDTAKNTAISTANNYTDTAIANMGDNYLAKNNTTYYEPTGAYNPATKKYVDDQKTQYTIMPTASNLYENKIVQYMGDTNQDYTQGYFYICISDGGDPATYTWEQIDVQDAVDLSNYLAKDNTTAFTPTADYQPATKKYVDTTAQPLVFLLNFNSGSSSTINTQENRDTMTKYRAAITAGKPACLFANDSYEYGMTQNMGGVIVPVYVNTRWTVVYISGPTTIRGGATYLSYGTEFRDRYAYYIELAWSGTTCTRFGSYAYQRNVYDIHTWGNPLGTSNTQEYTPTGDYNPATKKYVDDAVAGAGGAEVVSELPQTGDEGKIYIVKEGDTYHQYIYNTTDGWVELSGLTEFVQVPVTLTALRPEMTSEQIIEYLGGQDNVDKLLEAFENGTPIFGTNIDPTTGEYVQTPMTITVQDGDNGKQIHFGSVVEGSLWDMDLTYDETNGWSVEDVVVTPLATQAYVLGAINTAIGNLDITRREVVSELPTQDISTKTIYMVPSEDPSGQNAYDEYIWLGDKWELIGTTKIDLTNYATKDYVDEKSIVFIPGTVFNLSETDSSADIISKFGGQDNLDAILSALDNNDRFIAGVTTWNGQHGNVPVMLLSATYGGTRYLNLEATMQGQWEAPKFICMRLQENTATHEWSCTSVTATQLAGQHDQFTMPTASSASAGMIIQYVGDTNANYTNGYFYKCVYNENTSAYEWQPVEIQDLSGYVTADENTLCLPGTLLTIGTSDDSATITTKLGGTDSVNAILDAIQNGDRFIAGVGTLGGQYANMPVFITSVENSGVRTIAFEATMQGGLDRPEIVRIVLTENNGVLTCVENSSFRLASIDEVNPVVTTMPTTPGQYPYGTGKVVQYMGPTTNEYIQGHYYTVVTTGGTSTWEEIGDFVSHPELAEIVNNLNLNNMRYNLPAYYVDLISFSTEEPYITPSLDDVQAAVIAKMQEAYDAGKTKFYLVFRNTNGDHPIRSFPVLVDINTNTGVITTTGYKQVGSVNSVEAVSYTVSLNYGTWSLVNDTITHTGEHIGAYLVNKSTFNYLAKNNITAYTPTLDYHPATKRYVDDMVSNGITNGNSVVYVETMPTANAANFGKVVIYSGCEENVYWTPGHLYQCQQWQDEQGTISYHWVEAAKRDTSPMPVASEENYDLILQYKGEDTTNYKKGCFYRCAAHVVDGVITYAWEAIPVVDFTAIIGYDANATQTLKNINGTIQWLTD